MYSYEVRAIHRVIDGDTLDIELDLGFWVCITRRIRLVGIDAPEVKTLSAAEKARGQASAAWLTNKIAEGGPWRMETLKDPDKYGRILGTLYKIGEAKSVNNQMLLAGLAGRYPISRK